MGFFIRWTCVLFILFFSSVSRAWIPPVEFILEEWTRANHLKSPLHLKFEGALLNKNQSSSLSFFQECFVLPQGTLRVDIKFNQETLSLIRNGDSVMILSGKAKIYEGRPQSYRFLNLSYPASKSQIITDLEGLSLFSSKEFEFLRLSEPTKTNPSLSVALRRKLALAQYGKFQIAYAIPYDDDRRFLIDKVTLLPVGVESKDDVAKFQVQELKAIQDTESAVPQNVTFYMSNTLIHLNLSYVNPKAKMEEKWLDLKSIAKSTKEAPPTTKDDATDLFISYLKTFY